MLCSVPKMHSGELGGLGEAGLTDAEKNALLQVMQRAKVSSRRKGKLIIPCGPACRSSTRPMLTKLRKTTRRLIF